MCASILHEDLATVFRKNSVQVLCFSFYVSI